MKKLSFALMLWVVTLLAVGKVFAEDSWNVADNWNVHAKTGPETRPLIPIDLNLTLANFTVSSPCQISNVAFNTTISELSFTAIVTEADQISGYNIWVSMPSEILSNSSLIVKNSVDGKPNGYAVVNASTIGFYLYVGTHTITLNIYDPPETASEFSVMVLPLLMLMLLAVLAMKRSGKV